MSSFIFVADLFVDEYVGGAELTTEAIMTSANPTDTVVKVRCKDVTPKLIDENKDSHWIIGNFTSLSDTNKLKLCKTVNYSLLEYDYKFCSYRSMELHQMQTGNACDCVSRPSNKINLAFYGLAKKIWFMSDVQKNIFLSQVKTIKEERVGVLSSVFSKGDLRFIESISQNPKTDKYLIVKGNSWVKNFEGCLKYAQENELPYEVIEKLPYHELLIKLSTSKGLIFLPAGADTCPRLVIEACLLGCELKLNELVQHKNEPWFKNASTAWEYLQERPDTFWGNYE
jgi:hypothetical protein